MRVWCDKCENLVETEEIIRTSYGQFCENCYSSEYAQEDDLKELSSTDLLLMQIGE